jgi:hypothetical protein
MRSDHGILGGARARGSLGSGGLDSGKHDGLMGPPRGIYLADLGKNLPPGARPEKRDAPEKKTAKVILNIAGDFSPPWKNADEEKQVVEGKVPQKKWHPGTPDFEALARNTKGLFATPHDLKGFLGLIQAQKPKSIERINIFSHANPGLLAFRGVIKADSGDVYFRQHKDVDFLDEAILQKREWDPEIDKTEPFGHIAAALRDRFSDGAEITLFVCNSSKGVGAPLLQELANTFGVVVKGLDKEIFTLVDWDKKPKSPIDRGYMSLNPDCLKNPDCQGKAKGFAHLVGFRSFSPKPDKPSKE